MQRSIRPCRGAHRPARCRFRCSRHGAPRAAQDAKTPDYAAIVAAPDRSDADRQTDQRRQPAKMLAFTGAKPGMKVLDMGAGAGYSTELLARAVGPGGSASMRRNSAAVMERVKDKFDIRAQNPAMKNVVHVVRNYDDPIPPDVGGLDLITFFFAYHDTTYMPVDRAEMNRKMFAALKPGGFLVIADHSARPATAPRSARRCTGSRKARCARRSRRPASSSRPKPISCAIPKIRGTRRCSIRKCRSTNSC